ncbi:MAG: hypothetical protein ACI9MR_000947 [Myxococcota bacterium]
MSDTAHHERFSAIVTTGDSEDATLWALQGLLEETIPLPADARVGGERVLLSRIEYEGFPEQGLVAEIIVGERKSRVPLSDVHVLRRVEGSDLVLRYRRWRQDTPAHMPSAQRKPASPTLPTMREDGPVVLAVLGVNARAARCRRISDGSNVLFRLSPQQWVAPGGLITVEAGEDGATIAGAVVLHSVDATQLDLASDAPADPETIEQALQLAEFGDPGDARDLLHQRLADDLSDVAAHAALGRIAVEDDPDRALTHFAIGAAVAEHRGDLSGADYHRCLYGCGRALMRLGRSRDAWAPLEQLLSNDPDDTLGATDLLQAAGHPSPEPPAG